MRRGAASGRGVDAQALGVIALGVAGPIEATAPSAVANASPQDVGATAGGAEGGDPLPNPALPAAMSLNRVVADAMADRCDGDGASSVLAPARAFLNIGVCVCVCVCVFIRPPASTMLG